MDPEIAELEKSIQEAADLLHAYEETHWENWLRVNLHLIQNRQMRGLEGMLRAYGGMGSINDLYLHPHNGHKLKEAEVDSVNDSLGRLLGRIYALCDKLRREES
jgi:hypothetical protein